MPEIRDIQAVNAARGPCPAGRFAYAAAATPPGISGIAVVRMSGRSSFEIADEVFAAEYPPGRTVAGMDGYTCAYGRILDPATGETVDKVIVTKFEAPHSFTGEHTVEISCHGGIAAREGVLRVLYGAGARPAQPGEFTKNAFLNGKMDLTQAEAVMDLISSAARKSGAEAVRQLQGKLSAKIRALSSDLYRTISSLELILEFPDHEETPEALEGLLERTENVRRDIVSLIATFEKGRILREGFRVVIAGRPNAGKSSMLNALAGHDRAIVTEVPGTTRDTVEELIDIGGLPVLLIDTAGLRSSGDTIERLGIGKTREAIAGADLVLWVLDGEAADPQALVRSDDDFRAAVEASGRGGIALILSKSDIRPFGEALAAVQAGFPDIPVLPFSAVTEEGIDAVRCLIAELYEKRGAASAEEVIITNARHVHLLRRAGDKLDMAVSGMRAGLPPDITSGSLRGAAEDLAEITGDEVGESIVREIFARFCVGK